MRDLSHMDTQDRPLQRTRSRRAEATALLEVISIGHIVVYFDYRCVSKHPKRLAAARAFGKHEHLQHVAINPGILVKKLNWHRPF
jgi:hypothetical protein